MKLTIHKQAGDAVALDTTVEGSADDCLKVIDRLEDTKDKKYKIEANGRYEDVKRASEEWLRKLKNDRLFQVNQDGKQKIYLKGNRKDMLDMLSLDLDDNYPNHTLIDLQSALQKEVNEGRLVVK